MNNNKQLGDADFGNTDFFGLDDMGEPDGNPMLGAMVGTGLGSVTAIGIRKFAAGSPTLVKNAELIGAGAAVLAGAALYFTSSKSSGITAAVSGLLNNGLRFLEQKLFAPDGYTGALHGVVVEQTQALGRGMGQVDIQPIQALSGPVADYSQMPSLVGANLQAAADHIQLVGGPQLSQHAGGWGATVVGGGR